MLKVKYGYSFSSYCRAAGDEGGCSGASLIHYGEDGIIAVCFGQLGDEVQCDGVEGLHGCITGDVEQWGLLFVGVYLALLAFGTSHYIFFHPAVHPGPPIVLCNQGNGIVPSRVSCSG